MLGKIKGWNFFPKKLSADGSTTLESLKAEKKRLETRLAEIPGLISRLQNSVKLIQADIDWLNGLNNRKEKQWEKDNGKTAEQAKYDGANTIVSCNADIQTLKNESARIPGQITEVDRQISAMVQGESTGLSKGLSSATAHQLGQLELTKEREQIAHETAIQQVQLEQVKQQASAPVAKTMSPQVKNGIIIVSIIIIIAIIGYVAYKRKQAALAMPQPLKL